jgi:ribosomal protein S18
VIEKLVAIFALFALTIVPLHSALAQEKEHGCGEGTTRFRLGELTLCITEPSPEEGYLIKFLKGDEELFAGQCAFKTNEPASVPYTPLPDCSTLLAYCFSGGAHCCTTLFIATRCGPRVSLDMADLADADRKVKFTRPDGVRGKAMIVHDWRFAYYEPEDSQIQFSFADSPAMVRLLVYDNGRWRPDRVGECSRFYSRLLHKAIREARRSARKREPELTTALAMKAAYYSLMSGKPIEEAFEVLNRLFPDMWRHEAGKISRDIYRAVSEFNPVEAIR